MRHRKRRRNLSRATGHREALIRNLARSVILHRRIETTLAKAKRTAPFVEKLITLSKDGSLHSRRRALSLLHDKEAVTLLFNELAPNYSDVNGGYTRVLHLDKTHLGDNAPLAILELAHLEEPTDESEGEAEAEEGDAVGKTDEGTEVNADPEAESKETASDDTTTSAESATEDVGEEKKEAGEDPSAESEDATDEIEPSGDASESEQDVTEEAEEKNDSGKKA